MTIELGQGASALGMVAFAFSLAACGTQPITIGGSEAAEEPVAEQRQALGATSRYLIAADGAANFAVKSVEGGAVKAAVVSTTVGVNGSVNKFLGPRQIEPVTVPLGLGVPAAYVDWAKAGLNRQFSEKDFVLAQCDVNYKEVLSRSFDNSVLSGLSFGPFDVTEKSTLVPLFKASFLPERVTTRAGDGSVCKAPLGAKGSYAGQFRMALDGLDATGVTKIDELKLTRVVPDCSDKELNCAVPPSGSLLIPNLRVSIAESGVDSWLTWFNDFVVGGNDSAGKERAGEITLLAPDLNTAHLRIKLEGVGISRLTSHASDVPGNDIPAGQWVAELYVERITLVKP